MSASATQGGHNKKTTQTTMSTRRKYAVFVGLNYRPTVSWYVRNKAYSEHGVNLQQQKYKNTVKASLFIFTNSVALQTVPYILLYPNLIMLLS